MMGMNKVAQAVTISIVFSSLCWSQVLKLRKEARNVRRRADERQERRAVMFRELLERLLDMNTHNSHAVQLFLEQVLQKGSRS